MSRKEEKKEDQTAESVLSGQFGSDKVTLVTGKVNLDRLTKLGELDPFWIAYFKMKPKHRGGRFTQKFCENYENLVSSVEGWRINKMIQAIGAAKGTPTVGELYKKPGFIGRHVTDRKWKEKAEEKGATIVE